MDVQKAQATILAAAGELEAYRDYESAAQLRRIAAQLAPPAAPPPSGWEPGMAGTAFRYEGKGVYAAVHFKQVAPAPRERELSVPMTTVPINGREWVVPVEVANYIAELENRK